MRSPGEDDRVAKFALAGFAPVERMSADVFSAPAGLVRTPRLPPVTVLHVITGLNTGGAETMLARLVTHPAARRHGVDHQVLSLLPPGPLVEPLDAAGIPVHTLGMTRRLPGPRAVARLAGVVRSVRPAILQGWMHHGNLAASTAAWLQRRGHGGAPSVLWNVRHSLADILVESRATRAILHLQARTSRNPAAIIYNSRVAAEQYAAIGFSADHATVIPNGFDCAAYAPDGSAPARLRALFGIRGTAPVVAMVARNHPMKSADLLVSAIAAARKAGHDFHLLLVGNGMDRPGATLAAALAHLPPDTVTLSGERRDVSRWLPGADIVALPSSWGEAFPNILGEAMACGIPCVTTDVGDSGWIVGRTGLVVPPRDVPALAHALARLDRLGTDGRHVLGRAARARAITEFSLDNIAARYAYLYAAHAGMVRRGDAR